MSLNFKKQSVLGMCVYLSVYTYTYKLPVNRLAGLLSNTTYLRRLRVI